LKKLVLGVYLLLYLIAISTVILTAYIHGYENFLENMTKENGFFETFSLFILLGIFIFGLFSLYIHRKTFDKIPLILIGLFSFVVFLAAMEEISWGQQLFHFESSSFFMKNNLQHETNLHNLVDGNLFSSIVYSSVYTVFVFIPLFYKTILKKYDRFSWLHWFDIDPHSILMVLFASSFQVYFYDDFGVVVDFVTLWAGLLLFGYFVFSNRTGKLLKIHFVSVVLSSCLFMINYKIFGFYNMQYEIREMFVMLASLLIFIETVQKIDKNKTI